MATDSGIRIVMYLRFLRVPLSPLHRTPGSFWKYFPDCVVAQPPDFTKMSRSVVLSSKSCLGNGGSVCSVKYLGILDISELA